MANKIRLDERCRLCLLIAADNMDSVVVGEDDLARCLEDLYQVYSPIVC